jgi:hypothetical protein
MSSTERAQLLRLLAVLCDGQLSDGEQERLQELLLADPEARRTYLQYVDVHARLVMHPGLAKSRKMPPKEAWAWAALEEAAGMERRAAAWNARRRRGWTWQRIATYGAVTAATVAATLLLQFMLRTPPAPVAVRPILAPYVAPPSYVATLAQTSDAQWDAEHAALAQGSRLLPGPLKLESGLARIHFDSGVDLLVEAPAELRLETDKAAALLSGKVVFQAEPAAAPFLLRTPTSLLVDTGTEYGVEVGHQHEELHVFSGEVQREAAKANGDKSPELVAAGQARRYPADGGPTSLAPERFVRSLPTPPIAAPNPLEGLLAYEGFDYDAASDFKDGKGTGGVGWSHPWTRLPPWSGPGKARYPLNVEQGLSRPDAPAASIGGAIDYGGWVKYRRNLTEPVRLDEDGTYFLSFLFRREAPPAHKDFQIVDVRLCESGGEARPFRGPGQYFRRRMRFGLHHNDLVANLARENECHTLPLAPRETYLLVAKVVAGRDNPDQAFVRVYDPRERIDSIEPQSWSLVLAAVDCDFVLDTVEIEINGNRRQVLDELRLGTTWSSVAAPYVTTAAAQP